LLYKKLIYSILALNSLEEISKRISDDSLIRAEKFVESLILKVQNLKQFPNLGVNIGNGQYKYVLDKNYIAIYTVVDSKIYILHIINVKKEN